jgi:hypothetical protein
MSTGRHGRQRSEQWARRTSGRSFVDLLFDRRLCERLCPRRLCTSRWLGALDIDYSADRRWIINAWPDTSLRQSRSFAALAGHSGDCGACSFRGGRCIPLADLRADRFVACGELFNLRRIVSARHRDCPVVCLYSVAQPERKRSLLPRPWLPLSTSRCQMLGPRQKESVLVAGDRKSE